MTKRPPCPPHMSWISPYLTVKDPKASISFYEKAFNFGKGEVMADEKGDVKHAEMSYQGIAIMMGPEGCYGNPLKTPNSSGVGSPINLYVYCEDVDHLHKQAVKAGAKSLGEPETMFWGDRMCRLQDLDGYVWCFATNVGDFDPVKAAAAHSK